MKGLIVWVLESTTNIFSLKQNAMKTTKKNFEAKALTLDEIRLVDGGCPKPWMHKFITGTFAFVEWLEKQGRDFVDGFNDGTGNCS